MMSLSDKASWVWDLEECLEECLEEVCGIDAWRGFVCFWRINIEVFLEKDLF